MDNANPEEVSRWVAEQTAYLNPPEGWQPEPDRSALATSRAYGREPFE